METEKAGTATQQSSHMETVQPHPAISVHEQPPDRPPEGSVALSLESEPFEETVVRPVSHEAESVPPEPHAVSGSDGSSPSAVTAPPPFEPPAGMDKRFSVFHYNRLAFLTTTGALIFILLIGFGAWMFASHHSTRSGSQAGNNYSVGGNLNLGRVQDDLQLQVSETRHLTVNGELQVSDTLILTPGAAPSSPTAGQFYFDKSTDTPYYYNGNRFVSLAPSGGVTSLGGVTGVIGLGAGLTIAGNQLSLSQATLQQLANGSGPGVQSLQGQTGQVTLNAGPGITINGTTIGNGGVIDLASGSSNLVVGDDGSGHYTITDTSAGSGVTSITGTSNQVIVSSPTGNVVLSLPQSIATSSSPTFGGLTANGNTLIKTDSVAAFQVQNAAGNSNLLVANTVGGRIGIGTAGPGYRLDVQGGDINTSGIYRVNGAQISSANLSNDSNLAKLNGANIFTAANTFSSTVAIQGSNSLTLGTAANVGSIIFRDGATANLGTLQLGAALTGNATFNLPAVTGSQTLCTVESGNCAGSGSGITGSGTINRLAKFTAGQVLGDSSISDDGTVVTVLTGQIIQGSAGLTIGAGGVNGKLVLKNSSNGNTLTLQSGMTTGNLTFTLPTGDGADGDCLQTDGSGVLSFATCTGGVGGGVTSINTLTGVLNLVGTTDQINVGSAGDTLTLSLPQDIATTSSPSFRTLTVSGTAAGDNLIVANAVSGATGKLLDLKVNNVNKFTVSPNGDVSTTGQYQVNGTQISSANLSDAGNLAKLNGTGPQVFTGNNKFTGTVLTQLDSSTAFEIQNAAGTSNLLVADTTTTRLGVGTAAPGYTLDVNGDINTSGVYRINGVTICSSGGCTPSSGSGDYIQNGTSPQTANFNITGSGTIGTDLTVNGTISSPGSGTNSEHFGTLSSVGSNNYALAVGNNSAVISDYGTAVGQGAAASFGGTALGASANANAYSIAIGRQATTTAADQLVIGSVSDAIYDGYIGDGVTNATPTNFTLHATGGSGADIQGASLALAGGQGTGTGNGGDINFQIAKPAAISGSSLNTLSTVASLSGVNGAALFKNTADSTTAFRVQNAGGSNLVVADTTNGRVGINTGSLSPNTSLSVYNGNESLTQTDFTQNLDKGGINIVTDFTDGAYTPGLFWSTQDNNPTKPKAGIYMQEDSNFGTSLLFGTSGSYATGITNTALKLGPSGSALFKNAANSTAGFQVQDSFGAGLLTVNTSTGSTITAKLFVDTLGTGGSTALCLNGSSQVSTCSGTGSPFIQGGNSFGADGILGTNDNFGLNLKTDNTVVATFSNTGAALFKNASNSATAFQVQDAGSNTIFSIDTTSPSGYAAVNVGGNGTTKSELNLLQGTTKLWGLSTDDTGPLGTDGFNLFNYSTGDVNFALSATGQAFFKVSDTHDSAEAFQVQNASGDSMLNVNTSNASVNVNGTGVNGGGGRLTFGDYDPTNDLAVFVGEQGANDTDTLQLNGATGVQITSGDYSSPETVGYFNYDSARDSGVLALGESTSGGYLEFDNNGAFKWSIGMDSSDACGGTPSDALYFYTTAGGCALQFAHGGEATFTSEDDTNAFQILNEDGDQVINVDTTGTADTFLINQQDNGGGNLFHVQRQSDDAVIVDDGGHTTFRTLTGDDGSNAFRLQNSATNTTYFTTDSSNYTVTVSGTTTTFGNLTLTNAHFKSTQTTKPGNNTPTNCGTSPSAATASGSTDSAGSFTITTGTGSSSTTCDTQFNFNKSYGAAPKSIIVVPKTDAASAARQIYVSASAAGSFTVKFGVSAGGANSTTYSFYYWIVE